MSTELCWDTMSNGRYCKNYKLKSRNKCRMHYVNTISDYFTFKLMVILLVICSFNGYIFYLENTEFMDKQLGILRESMFQLYKNDKNIIPVYLNTLLTIASKMKLWIMQSYRIY